MLKPLAETIFIDLNGRFLCLDIITRASHRPDMILIDSENKIYIVGHKSNVDCNIKRKAENTPVF